MGLRTALVIRRQIDPLTSELPWLCDDTIQFMDSYLRQNNEAIVLEFGAGASTLFFANRCKHLISFESDPGWYERLRERIGSRPVDLRFYERPYANKVEEFPDEYFDLILVDGRDRVECVRTSRRCLKPNGIMIVDDTKRFGTPEVPDKYSEIPDLLEGWHRIDHQQKKSMRIPFKRRRRSHRTSIFTKPAR